MDHANDDGSIEGDVAGDGMFMGMISLPSRGRIPSVGQRSCAEISRRYCHLHRVS